MKKIILLFTNILISVLLFSQQEPIQRLNIKSPEVSAFERYGEIPVSNYTGVPEISIPIFKVRSGNVELPITLDYHATAIKVDQESTWVGLNWLLNTGGVISTEIPKSYMTAEQWGKLFNQMTFTDSRSSDFAITGRMIKFAGTHEMYSSSQYGRKVFTIEPDSQYDNDISRASYAEMITNGFGGAKTFHANFMGNSFSFIYHPVSQEYLVVGQDNKFVIQALSSGFTLISPDGFRYTFSDTETTTYSGGTPANMTPLILQSYYLTKVTSPTGRTIQLRYKKYGVTYPINKATETVHYGYKKLWGDTEHVDGEVYRKLSPETYTDNIYLSEVESDDALVRFLVSDRVDMRGSPKKLNNIEVYDKLNNKRIKRFTFGYDYYQGNDVGGDYIYDYYKYIYEGRTFDNTVLKFTSDQLKKRLRLLSLLEEGYDDNGTKINSSPYKFSYNTSSLPGKTSAACDYWGNYNGCENSGGKYYHTLLPDIKYLGEDAQSGFPDDFKSKFPKADQQLNPNTVGGGLLSTITYPTGGYSTFIFEPHKISNFPKSVGTSDGGWPITRTLEYWKSNFDNSLPVDYLTEKEFIVTKTTNITLSAEFYKNSSYSWDEFKGATLILYKMNLARTSNGSVMVYPAEAIRTYSYSSALSALLPSVNSKTWNESVYLEPGQYRMVIYHSFPQISNYDMSFKGRCHINLKVSNPTVGSSSNVDLLSEYKLSEFYVHDTDSDLKFDPNELKPKEFIVTEETGLRCNLMITTGGKYSWNKMEGSKAIIYKYPNTRNGDGTVSSTYIPYKQWNLSDFISTADTTKRIKNDTILLSPGKYRMEVYLSLPNIHPSDPASQGSKVYIELSVDKYNGILSDEVSADAIGVRIAQIKSYDGTTERTTKYKYLNTGIPTGIMMNPLKFTRKKHQIYQTEREVSVGGSCSGPGTAQLINYWQYSSNSQIPSANNNVGYSYVEVINEGIGHQTFTYWNQRNYSKDYLKPLPDPRNGNLLEHGVYTSSGQLSKKTTNKYTILKTDPYFVNAVMEDIYVGGDEVGKCLPLTNPYSRACPYNRVLVQIYPSIKTWIEKTQTTEENYFLQGKIIHDKNYTYNPSNLALAKKEETMDNGEIQKQYFVYPTDYSTTGYPSYLVSQNIINRPTEVVDAIKKENGEFIVNGTVNYYNNNGNISSVSNLEFTGDLAISSFKFSNKTENGNAAGNLGAYSPFSKYISKITAAYTTTGNIQNITKNNSENVVYLWSYNGQYPIAEIKNATYSQAETAAKSAFGVTDLNALSEKSSITLNQLSNLRNHESLKDAHVTTYTYKPLVGMLSATDPSGITTYYDYDAFGRMKETYIMENNVKRTIQSYDYHYQNQ